MLILISILAIGLCSSVIDPLIGLITIPLAFLGTAGVWISEFLAAFVSGIALVLILDFFKTKSLVPLIVFGALELLDVLRRRATILGGTRISGAFCGLISLSLWYVSHAGA